MEITDPTLKICCCHYLIFKGFVMRSPLLDPPDKNQLFDDNDYWEVPEEDDDERGPTRESINHHSVMQKHTTSMAVDNDDIKN